MRVLFDNGVPRGLAAALRQHAVDEARARGWDALRNGDLLNAAETAGFEVFVTTDRHLKYHRPRRGRKVPCDWAVRSAKRRTPRTAYAGRQLLSSREVTTDQRRYEPNTAAARSCARTVRAGVGTGRREGPRPLP